MGPSIEIKLESQCSDAIGLSEFVIIESSEDFDGDFDDNPSTSSSDGDASLSDDVFQSYIFEGRGRGMKENRPCHSGGAQGKGSGGRIRGGTDETYFRRRQRNNAAVKRSRDKARLRQRDSQRRLAELTAENSRLTMKADLLLKELSLLRGLFPAVGVLVAGSPSPPQIIAEADAFLSESSQ